MTQDAENFLGTLRARLLHEPPDGTRHDDYDLAPELREGGAALVQAAVLLPFVMRPAPHHRRAVDLQVDVGRALIDGTPQQLVEFHTEPVFGRKVCVL